MRLPTQTELHLTGHDAPHSLMAQAFLLQAERLEQGELLLPDEALEAAIDQLSGQNCHAALRRTASKLFGVGE
jgi:hypothetical protein